MLRFPRRRSVLAMLWKQPKRNTFLLALRQSNWAKIFLKHLNSGHDYNICVIMLAENLRLQTVEQVVFLIVGEHTLVVEHPTPSFNLTALSVSCFLIYAQALGFRKKVLDKPPHPQRKENGKQCAKH